MAVRQYGVMPELPKLIAMLRGSQNRHFVFGIDWLSRTITIFSDGYPKLVPIHQVKFVEPTEAEIETLNNM